MNQKEIRYVEIAFNISLNKTFHYSIPKDSDFNDIIYRRVTAVLKNRHMIGYVIGGLEKTDTEGVADIVEVLDEEPVFDDSKVQLAKWIADYYCCSTGEALAAMVPSDVSVNASKILKIEEGMDGEILKFISTSENGLQKKILEVLLEKREIGAKELEKELNTKQVHYAVFNLQKRGFLKYSYEIDTSRVNDKIVAEIILDAPDEKAREAMERLSKSAPKQSFVLKRLLESEEHKALVSEMGGIRSVQPLIEKGLVRLERRKVTREPYNDMPVARTGDFKLFPQQEKALDRITGMINEGKFAVFLLHGVTASGKTEIYLQTISCCLKKNKTAIVLVPEISLTPQTVERFRARFGADVAILHSRLSKGERHDQWWKIKRQEVKVVVGVRSAVFAPLENVGLIVLDEEHERTYKQDSNPRYHAREVAIRIARKNDAVVTLGSATPSMESYFNAINGKYELLEMPDRIDNKLMPKIEVIDMKRELKELENKSVFSVRLQEEIAKRLNDKQQCILFLNRRGFSSFVLCRSCGYVCRCRNCSVSLTFHITEKLLKCHYCGTRYEIPSICPSCRSKYIRYFGSGTQKVEEEVKRLFAGARVTRMDMDTTTGKDSHYKIFQELKNGEIDILVGTQMIAKGMDFPNVTLVGIIAADISLNMPDFRSMETTFSLIVQVAGRCGRGDVPGEVIVQSYNPENYSILFAKEHDYSGFYNHEINFRKELFYPPFSNLVIMIVKSPSEKDSLSSANELKLLLEDKLKSKLKEGVLEMLGACASPRTQLRGKYRHFVLIRTNILDEVRGLVRDAVSEIRKINRDKKIEIELDIDPIDIL